MYTLHTHTHIYMYTKNMCTLHIQTYIYAHWLQAYNFTHVHQKIGSCQLASLEIPERFEQVHIHVYVCMYVCMYVMHARYFCQCEEYHIAPFLHFAAKNYTLPPNFYSAAEWEHAMFNANETLYTKTNTREMLHNIQTNTRKYNDIIHPRQYVEILHNIQDTLIGCITHKAINGNITRHTCTY